MKKIFWVILLTAIITVYVWSVDDYWHYTSQSQVQLTVTNFGSIGAGNLGQMSDYQPSCQYPPDSGTEHIYRGGIWIGGKKMINDTLRTLVSTGAVDAGSSTVGTSGFEFAATASEGDTIQTYTNLDIPTEFSQQYYNPNAVSEEDFVCEYKDIYTEIPGTDVSIPDHTPMGLKVEQQSFNWSVSYASSFVILQFTVKNISNAVIEDVYVGLWTDTNVGSKQVSERWDYYDDSNGYIDSLSLCFEYDDRAIGEPEGDTGDFGYAESYVGVKFLGSRDSLDEVDTHFNIWQYRAASNLDYQYYTMPVNDEARYQKLINSIPENDPTDGAGGPFYVDGVFESPVASNWTMLLSAGNFGDLAPGQEKTFAFGIVLGENKEKMIENAVWAQKAFDNNYRLPSPPPSPNLTITPEDNKVVIEWDDFPEYTVDEVDSVMDFEGYRIYRKQENEEEWNLLAEFDVVERPGTGEPDTIGYNTGLPPKNEDGRYVFGDSEDFEKLKNGWGYEYAVTSFDTGNPLSNLPSLESSQSQNAKMIFPGKSPNAQGEVYVYPNPYKVHALWDDTSEGNAARGRLLWFANLPSRAEIKIYTLSGDLIDTIEHDEAAYDGSDIQRLSGLNAQYSGGEHGWDLITSEDQEVATGLYIFTVENLNTGDIKQGKFVVIK